MPNSSDNYGLYAIIFVAVVVVVFIFVTIKGKLDRKKAETGEDKARLREAVQKVLGEGNYTIVYSLWEDVQHYGRTTRTTYYHHAVAFDEQRMWIMPLRFERELILPDQPILVTSDMLGIVDVSEFTNKKTGQVNYVAATLNDKNGKQLVKLSIHGENTKDDRFHHLNLLQEEECTQFFGFISAMAGQVAADNADLPGRLEEERVAKMNKYARNCLIPGFIFSVLLPFVGLILGIIALIYAPKPKATGGKPGLAFILSIVCILLSLAMMIFFMSSNPLWQLLMPEAFYGGYGFA